MKRVSKTNTQSTTRLTQSNARTPIPETRLTIVDTASTEASDNENAALNDLARLQDILVGTTARQLELRLAQLESSFTTTVEQLKEQFSQSVTGLREEASLAIAGQQQALADSHAQIMGSITEAVTEINNVHLQSEKQAAAALASARQSFTIELNNQAREVQQSQAHLQQHKVDRAELATMLQQMARQLHTQDPVKQTNKDIRKR